LRASVSIFVLVHGSWHGGWCWKKLTIRLVGCSMEELNIAFMVV
jgi:hypothetical protein